MTEPSPDAAPRPYRETGAVGGVLATWLLTLRLEQRELAQLAGNPESGVRVMDSGVAIVGVGLLALGALVSLILAIARYGRASAAWLVVATGLHVAAVVAYTMGTLPARSLAYAMVWAATVFGVAVAVSVGVKRLMGSGVSAAPPTP